MAQASETGEKYLTSLHTLSQFANPKVKHKAKGSGWVGGGGSSSEWGEEG